MNEADTERGNAFCDDVSAALEKHLPDLAKASPEDIAILTKYLSVHLAGGLCAVYIQQGEDRASYILSRFLEMLRDDMTAILEGVKNNVKADNDD